MTDLRADLGSLPAGRVASPWPDHELASGYGVMNLPWSTGHLLGLRVFPSTSLGGYTSLWHRDPAGRWFQHVSGAPVEHGCPRYWGPALERAAPATITTRWTGPDQLEVTMDQPALRWWLRLRPSPALALVNLLNAPLPLATWRRRMLVAARERLVRLLGMGAVSLSGPVPSGGHLTAALRRMYWVAESTAEFDGQDLGHPVELSACPMIAGWPLPRRGVLAVGEALGQP